MQDEGDRWRKGLDRKEMIEEENKFYGTPA